MSRFEELRQVDVKLAAGLAKLAFSKRHTSEALSLDDAVGKTMSNVRNRLAKENAAIKREKAKG